MHTCPNCQQTCDCDGEDIWNDFAALDCTCDCEDDYSDDDEYDPDSIDDFLHD